MAVTAGWTTYQLRRQMIAIGEDFWIANAQGENVYKLDGKVLTLTQTFALQDSSGNELARMRAEMLTLRRTMDIERGGEVIAVVKKAFINVLGQSFSVAITGDGELQAHGDILNHEFQITGAAGVVATVSRQWFIGDLMYGIAIAPGQDEVLMLCIAIAIDEMSEDDRRR
ncbi:MAG TPA: LURP-one-related family protein [Candidatus Dormibacteraeota bacterium]|nr:LURP-one-related family protein [Candidatus Dormibacteraeota bacterium]